MRANALLGAAFLLIPALARSHNRPEPDVGLFDDVIVTDGGPVHVKEDVNPHLLRAELANLHSLHLQMRKIEEAIQLQEDRLVTEYGWSPIWQMDEEEDCDGLKCRLKHWYERLSDAAVEILEDLSGNEELVDHALDHKHHGPGRKHGKGKKHRKPHWPGLPHHGWPHYGGCGNHTGGNHTFPPHPPHHPHPPPPCHCPPPPPPPPPPPGHGGPQHPPPPDRPPPRGPPHREPPHRDPPHREPPHHGPPFDRPPFDGPPHNPPPHHGPPSDRPPFDGPPHDLPPHHGPPDHGPPRDEEPPSHKPPHHGPPDEDRPPHGPPDHHRPPPPPPPPPPPHHGPPRPPHLLAAGLSVALVLVLIRALHIRFSGGKSCCAARREARRRRQAQHRGFFLRLFFRGWFSDDEDEEKASMLRHHVEEEQTMEQEIASCRMAADVVGDMVAAEEGRAQPVVQNMAQPSSPQIAFAQYIPEDEVLPAYDAASSDDSSIVADGMRYTPGSSEYTPSVRSVGGGADDVLGDTKQ